MYIIENSPFSSFLSLQLSGIKDIHTTSIQHFLSYKTAALTPLNTNSHAPTPSPWQPPFYLLSLWICLLWVPHRHPAGCVVLWLASFTWHDVFMWWQTTRLLQRMSFSGCFKFFTSHLPSTHLQFGLSLAPLTLLSPRWLVTRWLLYPVDVFLNHIILNLLQR